jgi:hypothetical protein
MIRLALACFLAFSITAALGDDVVNLDPVAADLELGKLADLIKDAVPPEFKEIRFKTTKSSHDLESEATIVWKGRSEDNDLMTGLLFAARIYAGAIAKHHSITKAVVFFDTPKGKVHAKLKLQCCSDLLKAELARPRDQKRREKALADFYLEHIGEISDPHK